MATPAAAVHDRWVFWALLGLLFWAPLPLGSNRTWAISILVVWSQILLLAALYCWHRVPGLAMARLRAFRWPLFFLVAFVGLVWLQLLPLPAALLAIVSPETLAVQANVATLRLSLDPQQTTLYAALSFAYLSCFVVVLLTIRDARRLDHLALALVVSGLLQAVIGVLLFSAGAHYRLFFTDIVHINVIGTFVNRNHLAGYLELCLATGIGLMLARLGSESRQLGNWRHRLSLVLGFILSPKMRLRLILVVLVIALVLTRSRMGNSAFFAALLFVGLIAIALSRKMAPATVGLIASLVVIDVLVVGTWVGLDKVVHRVQQTSISRQSPASQEVLATQSTSPAQEQGGREESVQEREDAAQHALSLVRDFPIFGTGGGSFYNAYLRYRTPREGYFDHAHNDYVELAADYGLVGLGLLGGFVLATVICSVKILLRRRSSLPRGMAFATLMAVVALAIHSTVDFNLQIPANALTLLIVMALAWIAQELPRGARTR